MTTKYEDSDDFENEEDREFYIQMLQADINLLKNTLNNVNNYCQALEDSNILLKNKVDDLNDQLNYKGEVYSKFLKTKGFTIEDLLEFETELKAGIQHQHKGKKRKD